MSRERSSGLLKRICRLPTSGARAAAIYELEGGTFLAVPQLAYDMPDTEAYMNGGDSDTDLLIFRWTGDGFEETERLPAPGGEDAEFFEMGGEFFLAVASARRGKGPYEPDIESTIHRRHGGRWTEFQKVPTFFAKQFRHFAIGDRDFLALALGVTAAGHAAEHHCRSMILEWNGERFVPFQTLEGPWGYNWCHFQVEGRHFLAYADHVAPSRILEWDGARFIPFQLLEGETGRAFQAIEVAGQVQLAFATIAGDTSVLAWNGAGFEPFQRLSGPGGRELAARKVAGTDYLVQVNFIEGTPKAPKTDLVSLVHAWDGLRWRVADRFTTFGATDASFFSSGGRTYLVVANSLTPDIRFRQDSVVYEFLG